MEGQTMGGLAQFLKRWAFRLSGTACGVLFGVFGWQLLKGVEVAWYLLIYYPALFVSQFLHLGNNDRAALTATALLYGVLGFLTGWALDAMRRRLAWKKRVAGG